MNVAYDSMNNNQMKMSGSLKKLADLLYDKWDVQSSDGEINKTAYQFPV